jgi:hypothetical protein
VREIFFNGQNIRYSIPYENKNKLYLPILIDERYFLSEIDIEDEDILTDTEILAFMVNQIKAESWHDFTYSVEGQTLNLKFENYDVSAEMETDKWDMLIESVLYSVTSTNSINNLLIESLESGVDSFGSYPVNTIITPNLYLNPIN